MENNNTPDLHPPYPDCLYECKECPRYEQHYPNGGVAFITECKQMPDEEPDPLQQAIQKLYLTGTTQQTIDELLAAHESFLNQKQQPTAPIDEQALQQEAEELYHKLNDFAEEVNNDVFGLPLRHDTLQKGVAIITDFLRKYTADKKELEDLRRWKAEAIAVMPDYQKIAKLLNIKLGESVHDKIVPAIEQLQADKKQVEWISVKERLPEAGKRVLCLPKGYPFRMICEQYWEAYADQNDAWFKETFLYWQPLPEPPATLNNLNQTNDESD